MMALLGWIRLFGVPYVKHDSSIVPGIAACEYPYHTWNLLTHTLSAGKKRKSKNYLDRISDRATWTNKLIWIFFFVDRPQSVWSTPETHTHTHAQVPNHSHLCVAYLEHRPNVHLMFLHILSATFNCTEKCMDEQWKSITKLFKYKNNEGKKKRRKMKRKKK